MSDIVEDSKIHFIVKDYRRMYNGFHALVKENKELRKEVMQLKLKVEKLGLQLEKKEKVEVKKVPSKRINGVLNEIEVKSNAIINDLQKRIESLNGIIKNAEEVRLFLKEEK